MGIVLNIWCGVMVEVVFLSDEPHLFTEGFLA